MRDLRIVASRWQYETANKQAAWLRRERRRGGGGVGGVGLERPALTSPRQSYNLLIVWEPPLLLSFNRFVWGESRCLLLMCPIAQVAYRI